MKNKKIININVILAVLIIITTIFTGCNIGSQVSTNRPEQESEKGSKTQGLGVETEDTTSNSEVIGDELVTESEMDTETEIDI